MAGGVALLDHPAAGFELLEQAIIAKVELEKAGREKKTGHDGQPSSRRSVEGEAGFVGRWTV